MPQSVSRPRCYVSKYSDTAKECGICVHRKMCSSCWKSRIEIDLLKEPYRTMIKALQLNEMTGKELQELVRQTGRAVAYTYIQRLSALGILNVVKIGRTKVYSLARKFEV